MFRNKKVIIFDLDGTLIDSIGIWNKTDELLIKELSGNNEVKIKDIAQIRDSVLAECKSEDIYLEYCGYLGKKYNSSMTSEQILNLRWQISDEYIKNYIDYKPKYKEEGRH